MHKPICTLFCVFILVAASLRGGEVNLESLLDEMVDRPTLSQKPDPAYTCKQFSSYDRRSKDEGEPGWFSNDDNTKFLREEVNEDRREWVMVDAEGPGAIVRWWITAGHYRTTFRIYIDGKPEPAIEARADELVGGDSLVGAPLSADRARGRNLYFPIPYAKSVKITADNFPEQGILYYAINYRTYEPGTKVRSFTIDELVANKEKIEKVSRTLSTDLEGGLISEKDTVDIFGRKNIVKPGDVLKMSGTASDESGAAVVGLQVKLTGDDRSESFWRSTILNIAFDNPEDGSQVYCPVGDFFGSGVGVNPHRSWYNIVEKDGTMRCYWVMPYKKSYDISLENHGDAPVTAELIVKTKPMPWTERSMYFHADWRQERNMDVKQDTCERDWEFIRLEGEGVFVGDVLALWNHHTAWWGEGDEKIYVDGEAFPSHYGTGSEDYYGYAWATVNFFEAPFHAQPRVEGPVNYGHTTNLRVRDLDAIPFEKSFRFDMELWHWVTTQVDYAATVYWYGKPGAKAVGVPSSAQIVAEARQSQPYRSPKFLPSLSGFKLLEMTGGNARMQGMEDFAPRKWKDDNHVLWEESKPGDEIEFKVESTETGTKTLVVELTKAFDYGTFQFYFDGKEIGEPIDLFNDGSLPDCVVPTGRLAVGTIEMTPGSHRLGVKNVGKNERSRGMLFGIDEFRFE